MLPNNPKSLSARRLVPLASVAAVGTALLMGGRVAFTPVCRHGRRPRALPIPTMQHPSGFADIVTKKPAVISVRVKI